jgi:hypothetical protein
MSLLVIISIFCVDFALIGRERRHEQATEVIRQIGGHTSPGREGLIVYFWRLDDGFDMRFVHVTDLEAAIRSLRQLKCLSHIVLLQNHRDWEPVLRKEFPRVKIEVGHAGVI